MTTKLEGPLKRELDVGGAPYTLTISPDGLNLVPKGRRIGYALAWPDLVSGEAALATALNASLARAPKPRAGNAGSSKTARKATKNVKSVAPRRTQDAPAKAVAKRGEPAKTKTPAKREPEGKTITIKGSRRS
jgi:hypothetical protein